MKELAISLDALTAQDKADIADAMRAGGIDPSTVNLTDVAGMPPLVLAALIHVTVRRNNPHATHTNSIRMALAAQGVGDGG